MNRIAKRLVPTRHGYTHVSEAGDGDRTIAFVTIASFASAFMPRVLTAFADAGYRTLALDIMGYGRSDKRQFNYTIADFADPIEETLASCGAGELDCLVTGHFSAMIGIEMAARRHAGFRKLILDGTPVATAQARADYLAGKVQEPVKWDDDGHHALEYWRHTRWILSHLDPDFSIPAVPDHTLREAYVAIVEATGFEPKTMHAYLTFPLEERLAAVTHPTLLMTSEADWNRVHHDRMRTGLPMAQSLIWPHAHPLHQLGKPERVAEYVAAVDAFVRA